MRVREVDGRVVLLALLVTLGIYLAAGGASEDEIAHAGSLNQTIPTMTPTGATSTPTVSNPTEPPPTQAPTEPPGVPSDTPSPTSTAPSSTPTDTPTSSAATATSSATPTLTPTVSPTAGGPMPTLTQASITASPTAGPATGTAAPASDQTATPDLAAEITSVPQPSVSESVQTPAPAEPTRASGGSVLANSSCLWIALGLVLMLAGLVLLIRWRRSGGGSS